MRTLRLNLAMKGRDFAVSPLGNPIHIDQQIIGPSWNFSFLASFHGHSEKLNQGCIFVMEVADILKSTNKKIFANFVNIKIKE